MVLPDLAAIRAAHKQASTPRHQAGQGSERKRTKNRQVAPSANISVSTLTIRDDDDEDGFDGGEGGDVQGRSKRQRYNELIAIKNRRKDERELKRIRIEEQQNADANSSDDNAILPETVRLLQNSPPLRTSHPSQPSDGVKGRGGRKLNAECGSSKDGSDASRYSKVYNHGRSDDDEGLVDSDGDVDISKLKALKTAPGGSRVPHEAPGVEGGSQKEGEGGGEERQGIVYRDSDGFRITKEKWLEIQQGRKGGYRVKGKERDGKDKRKDKQQTVEWGGGVVQIESRQRRKEEEERIAMEPLTRYEIDERTDREIRAVDRWGDPLKVSENSAKEKWDTASSPPPSKPKCRFPMPPNRFNIQPGYRWDGLIRGNGFEQRLLESQNVKEAQQELAYKWSTEEM